MTLKGNLNIYLAKLIEYELFTAKLVTLNNKSGIIAKVNIADFHLKCFSYLQQAMFSAPLAVNT